MNLTLYFYPPPTGLPGMTVSKLPELPAGDFDLDEYEGDGFKLWFVRCDNFTADERQAAFEAFDAWNEENEAWISPN